MKAGKKIVAGASAVLAVAVAGVAAVGVYAQARYGNLSHAAPYVVAMPETVAMPSGFGTTQVDRAMLAQRLSELAAAPALGDLHGVVVDAGTGDVIWQQQSDQPLTPASATKLLTAAAAILTLDPTSTVTTDVVRGDVAGSVVIKAAGDVWLDDAQLDALAAEVAEATGNEPIDTVLIDTSVWQGPEQLEGWDPGNVDGGYVAPLQPAMMNGGRLGAATGDVPRSHTPALDVAQALATRLGAVNVGTGPAPAGAEVLGTTESEPLAIRMQDMLRWSDNVAAEAIGREVALARGAAPTGQGAADTTLAVLAEAGLPTASVTTYDSSGLSEGNLITPDLLAGIVTAATSGDELRPLVGMLPVAHGVGTLQDRYEQLPGRGYVRAKTGTLTGTNALVGTVIGESGQVYNFALLSNGSAIDAGRGALDVFASELRAW
ncbi:D-alanyl-D-alanine carboxypeptidase/D-alanyl-D-alanine endopeptidase [Corynebacterium uterequi]|uniref:D-alanyl-D-alanine carboxypeptidase (Penicillin-binding protein 4) n=1 Tax=Corynebacterium uterequi TaxID=1072256 RepID=A0A0G3HEV0_9CORY|nr:D-alanyl-D-alanine carboxypeptidase/D-alanyl-D-alanine-endopeptidase [Corynebacterium uterequi]AKK11881.1 D-alanyl-D-alanine carboxypeptidase (penicillin-binding protein 4) [Corynebacterium uterequi]